LNVIFFIVLQQSILIVSLNVIQIMDECGTTPDFT